MEHRHIKGHSVPIMCVFKLRDSRNTLSRAALSMFIYINKYKSVTSWAGQQRYMYIYEHACFPQCGVDKNAGVFRCNSTAELMKTTRGQHTGVLTQEQYDQIQVANPIQVCLGVCHDRLKEQSTN